MSGIRFTIVDEQGTVSFIGPGHALKIFAAACSRGVQTHRELLTVAKPYDAAFVASVLNGLAVFDEHNTPENVAAIRTVLTDGANPPPFRVVDELTKSWSLKPARAGVVVFNLVAKRIVQVQNSYADLERQGRGRIRTGGKPTGQLFAYQLPDAWRLVP